MTKLKTLFIFGFIVFIQINSQAQSAISQTIRATNIIQRFSQGTLTTGDMIVSLPTSERPEIEGNTYWDEHWSKTAILLYDREQLIEGHITRYDIYKDEFEFRLDKNVVKVLPGKMVNNIVWIDSLKESPRYLINAKEYKEDGVPMIGFLEVL